MTKTHKLLMENANYVNVMERYPLTSVQSLGVKLMVLKNKNRAKHTIKL